MVNYPGRLENKQNTRGKVCCQTAPAWVTVNCAAVLPQPLRKASGFPAGLTKSPRLCLELVSQPRRLKRQYCSCSLPGRYSLGGLGGIAPRRYPLGDLVSSIQVSTGVRANGRRFVPGVCYNSRL